MISNVENKITTNEDIDKVAIPEGQKMNSLQLDFKGGNIDKQKFSDLLNKLQTVKGLQKFELDLTSFPLDNDQITQINTCFKNFDDLRELYLHVSETNLYDDQFDRLLNETLDGKKSIEKLHLVLENVNMSDSKRTSINKLIKNLPNLNNVHINVQRNNLTKDEIADLHRSIFHHPHRVLLW